MREAVMAAPAARQRALAARRRAVDGDDDAHGRPPAHAMSAPRAAHQRLEIRESWSRSSMPSSTVTARARPGPSPESSSRCDDPYAVATVPPPGTPSPPRLRRSDCLGVPSTVTPQASGRRQSAARRSLSLTRNSSSPRMTVRAFGKGGGDGEDGIFVDHAGRALGRHLDAVQRTRSAREDRPLPRRHCRAGWRWSMSRAHFSQRLDQARCGAGLSITFSMRDVRTRHDQRGHQRKRRRGRIARHRDRRRLQLGFAGDAKSPCAVGDRSTAICRAEGAAACARYDRASAARSIDGGAAGHIQRGQQQRRLHLRRRHLQSYAMGTAMRAPISVTGRSPPSRACAIRAEQRQGLEHAPHRAPAQRRHRR